MPKKEPWDFGAELRKAANEIKEVDGSATSILAEEPVPLSIFVQDKAFLGNPPLSNVQYDAVRHIERIYYPAMYPMLAEEFEAGKRPGRLHIMGSGVTWRDQTYWSDPLRMINFATLQWGKGSGKDHICRIASMRIAYLLMCLESPQTYYGMPEQDTIHLLNVASSSGQAQQAFFMPIVRAVKKGWFVDKCIPRQNVISYAKNIESVSGHSDAESQEGLNLLLAIADEIDAFKSKKEMVSRRGASSREPTKSAEGILNMMRTSSSTRFPEVFKNVRISYPRYLGSTIQHLTDEARADFEERGSASRHYVSGPMATWEVNPRVPGREAFAEDYREDPVMARAKYECRPARAINPYFRNVQAVDSAFVLMDRLPLTVTYAMDRADGSNRRVWSPRYQFADSFFPVRGAIYTMHADLAVQGDRAGIAMAHVVDYTEHEAITTDEDGAPYTVREVRPRVKVDFVISYTADQSADPPREIQIRWARQLCFELIRRGFNIKLFSFDSFQCMSGDTKIPLLDGTTKTLSQLAGADPFWLYSIKDGRIVPGLCTKAWRTGLREDMLEVELDNGEKLRTTSDHRFMLRNGTYRRADQLGEGDSLMPLYRRKQPHNHTVVAIRQAPPEDVYDLQVEDHHNFATAAGVFVHNSTDSMQILESKGIDTEKISTDLSEDPWRNLRDLVYEGRIEIPRLRVQDTDVKAIPFILRDELLSLSRMPNGRVDHPSDGSKDEADALACAAMTAVQLGGREEGNGERRYYEPSNFDTGQLMELPFGVTSLRGIWTTGLPSPF